MYSTIVTLISRWNKIQQAAGIPNNSPFAIQLNGAPMPPSEAPHQTNYHSHPPQGADHTEHMDSNHNAQPAATITVLNEQPDLLPQSAKAAQELLQEIQMQLQKLQEQKSEPTKHIDTPTTHEEHDKSDNKAAKDEHVQGEKKLVQHFCRLDLVQICEQFQKQSKSECTTMYA